jgi:hypothetical protein
MAPKKKLVKQQPFLNSMARKLGHAAGTITKATHDFADNVSTLTGSVATKMQEVSSAAASDQTKTPIRSARKTKKQAGSVVRARSTKSPASGSKNGKKSKVRRSSR